jgi:pimeloyl-ACP methyl ester carboxylesterase
VAVVAAGAFVWWAETPYEPTGTALLALESDSEIAVVPGDDFIVFRPTGDEAYVGVILYPGGRVDFRAYAPLAREIALHGYLVAIVDMPLNLAVFDANRADRVIAEYPDVVAWVVGGHSLGGAMASTYAENHPDRVAGLLLLAAYPPSNVDLTDNQELEAVSIYGTSDGVLSEETANAAVDLLPDSTTYVPIEGGNHAQFGDYGPQSGDNPATIDGDDQRYRAANAIALKLRPLRIKTLSP